MINQDVLRTLTSGGAIHQAENTGEFVLLDKAGARAIVQPTVFDLINLVESGEVVRMAPMDTGHRIFPGRVFFYKINPDKKGRKRKK